MLAVPFGIAPPTVIGDYAQHVGAFFHIIGNVLSVHAFITYYRGQSQRIAQRTEHRAIGLGHVRACHTAEVHHSIPQQSFQKPPVREMLDSRHQTRLVVYVLAKRRDLHGRIVHVIPYVRASHFIGGRGDRILIMYVFYERTSGHYRSAVVFRAEIPHDTDHRIEPPHVYGFIFRKYGFGSDNKPRRRQHHARGHFRERVGHLDIGGRELFIVRVYVRL